MPIIILGGIYGGIFTPTEAAAVAVVYGLVIGVFVYKTVKPKDLYRIFIDSASTTATIMFITACASLFAYVLTRARLDIAISNGLINFTHGSTFLFFIIVNILLLIAGCFLDSTSALYIFTPLFVPVAQALGIDMIHLGVVMIVNLAEPLCGLRRRQRRPQADLEGGRAAFDRVADRPAHHHLHPRNLHHLYQLRRT